MPSTFDLRGGAARRVSEVPALRAFVEVVHSTISEKSEAFWNCEAAFSQLLQTSFITDVLNYELAMMVESPDYLAAGASTDVNFTVASTASWGLSVRLMRAPPTVPRLLSGVEHNFLGVPLSRCGPLLIDDYQRCAAGDGTSTEGKSRLLPLGRKVVQPGQFLRRRAGIDVGRFIYDGMPVIFVVFSSGVLLPLRWDYDMKTLNARRTIAGDVRSSRIEFATKLLARIGDASSLPQLQLLCSHKDHFVRWGAIRAIVAIDSKRGLDVLEEAIHDPHPDVALVASAALSRVQAYIAESD
jgi:hypothetical protein